MTIDSFSNSRQAFSSHRPVFKTHSYVLGTYRSLSSGKSSALQEELVFNSVLFSLLDWAECVVFSQPEGGDRSCPGNVLIF